MSQTGTLRVRLTLFCLLVGIVLATVAVVTDHWAVLSPEVEHYSAVCEAAHFGLWRICTKSIIVGGSKEGSCGPITLPGEKNCSYFRHFNPGESSEIFEFTTQKVQHLGRRHRHLQPRLHHHGDHLRAPGLHQEAGLPAEAGVHVLRLRRALHLRVGGGAAAVGEAHDRQRGHRLDRVLLLLVLRLRLRRLRAPLPGRPGPAALLPASHAPQPLGVLHGLGARALALPRREPGPEHSREEAGASVPSLPFPPDPHTLLPGSPSPSASRAATGSRGIRQVEVIQTCLGWGGGRSGRCTGSAKAHLPLEPIAAPGASCPRSWLPLPREPHPPGRPVLSPRAGGCLLRGRQPAPLSSAPRRAVCVGGPRSLSHGALSDCGWK